MKKSVISVIAALVMLISVCIPFTAAAKKPVYVSLGDSIAFGAMLANRKNEVAGALVSATNGYDYINDAVNGSTTGHLLSRLKGNLNSDRHTKTSASDREDVKKADIICISIGGNDFLTNNSADLIVKALAGDYTRMDKLAGQMNANFAQIISEIKALNPGAFIMVHTLYNPMYISRSMRSAYQQAADRVNSMVKGYLEKNPGAYTIVDVASAFGDTDESLIAVDYIHPSAKGQRVIANEVLKILKANGLGANTEVTVGESVTTLADDIIFVFRKVLGYMFILVKLA